MNVYDFDDTVYDGDSTLDFYFYCLRKTPSLVRYWPIQAIGYLKYLLKQQSKTKFKESFYRFLAGVPDIDAMLREFCVEHAHKLKGWYLRQKREDDVIITASPEFLVIPLCTQIGIRSIIGSRVDPRTGRYTGENCHGGEKVCRFLEVYNAYDIQAFYSDSESDLPMASLASKCYLVKKDRIMALSPCLTNEAV